MLLERSGVLKGNVISVLKFVISICCCVSPQSSHLALIDTLMMAYTVEMVSVERVMSCINRCSSAEPSHSDGHMQELPYDTEDAITTWINKVNTQEHISVHTKPSGHMLSHLRGEQQYIPLSPLHTGDLLFHTQFFVSLRM